MNDDLLRRKLRGLADAEPAPDETAAWAAITSGIEADERRSRRTRWIAGGGLLAAAAAATLIVVASTGGDDRQAIDVGPAATTSPTSLPTTPTTALDEQAGVPITLPSNPVVFAAQGGSLIHVLDGDTGERVTTPGPALPEDERYLDPVMTASGDIYVTHLVPEGSSIAHVRWDGSTLDELSLPGLASEADGYAYPAVSLDGRTVAVSVTNATGDGGVVGSLGLFDTVTHDFSVLSWPDDRGNLAQPQQISFSPNGTRIAFVNAHDTDGTEGFKGYVVDVDAASLGDAALLHGELWDVTYAVFGAGHEVLVGLVGDTLETAQPQLVLPDSDPAASSVSALSLHAELPGVTDIFSSNGIFSLYAKAGDKVLRYDEISPTWEPTGFEAWTG